MDYLALKMDSSQSPVFYSRNQSDDFFRKRHNAGFAFIAGMLLFLLPFAEYRCTDYTIASNTGWGIASGKEWKAVMLNDLWNSMKSMSPKKENREVMKELRDDPNIFAIAALAAGAIGLVVGLTRLKGRSLLILSAGILGVLMLVGLLVQLKLELKNQLSAKDKGEDSFGLGEASGLVTIRFTIWYYLSLLSFATAAFFGFRQHRIELDDAIRAAHEFEFQQKKEETSAG